MTPSTGVWTRRARAMKWRSLVSLSLLILIILPPLASAKTVGISQNDSLTFDYTIFTTFSTPNGNHTAVQHNQFTISILAVDTTSQLGQVEYTEVANLVNDTIVSTPSTVQNVTTIFDPYDNNTYLGNIGFYPFTYTDLPAGSVKGLNVSLTLGGVPGAPLTGTQKVNATVARSPTAINVTFTIESTPSIPLSQTDMTFNATNGVLMHGVTSTHFFGIEKDFTYDLVAYRSSAHTNSSNVIYLGLVVLVAAAVVAAYAFARRPSRRQRTAAKMRRKLG